ncbi:TPA: SDR family NAD(P)-dependent oxidoreductase [Klebsiella variicola subsp. variicola]
MNRLIVITGASCGIGKSIVERFSAAGDKVLLIARNENQLIQTISDISSKNEDVELDYIALDVSKVESISLLRKKIDDYGKPVDALICCAGAASLAVGSDIPTVYNEWMDSYNSNVMTAVLTIEGLESIIADNGSIVLFSSIAAYRGSGGSGAYGAMKSALHSYAHTLALRFGTRGINVNVIAPGYISETNFFGDRLTNGRRDMLIKQTILGRPGKPSDCAGLCFYLCSNEGEYITSQIFQINGGSNHGV